MEELQEEVPNYDETESIWKIDGPIGRMSYFWITLGVLLILVAPALLIRLLMPFLVPIALILVLIGIYLSFVATAKRFYDITGDSKKGTIIAIVLILLQWVFSPIGFVILALCLFVPGKFIK